MDKKSNSPCEVGKGRGRAKRQGKAPRLKGEKEKKKFAAYMTKTGQDDRIS